MHLDNQLTGEYELSAFNSCHNSNLITRLIFLNDGTAVTEIVDLDSAKRNDSHNDALDEYGFAIGYTSDEYLKLPISKILDERNQHKYTMEKYLSDLDLGYLFIIKENEIEEISHISKDQDFIQYKGNEYKKVIRNNTKAR